LAAKVYLKPQMACKLTVSSINELGYREFIVRFGNVVEGNSLCAAAVWSRRPFSSFENFVGTMRQFIDDLPQDGKAGILRSFLDLTARWESLSCDSQREQTETSIRKLINDEEFLRLKHYVNLYREKFGFTFVICARLHDTKDSVLEKVLERLKNNENRELETGIEEVKKIMILRMKDLVDDCQTSKLQFENLDTQCSISVEMTIGSLWADNFDG